LGAGGEDVQALPGVSREMLKQNPPPQNQPALISANITGLANDPTAVEDLAGFGDGSVRFSGGEDSDGGTLGFRNASFFGTLTQLDPANPNAWGGTLSLTDAGGNSIDGILIGLLRPGTGLAAPVQSSGTLDSLIIVTHGVGLWAGAEGTGHATINRGTGTDAPFRGTLLLVPAVQRGEQDSDR
jgi:hypothetical protein